MSATAFANAFTEFDAPRSSGAVSRGFGRDVQPGCWSVPSWWRAGALPSFAFSPPLARGLLYFFCVDFGRAKRHLRSQGGRHYGCYLRSRARCEKKQTPRFYLTQILTPEFGHTLVRSDKVNRATVATNYEEPSRRRRIETLGSLTLSAVGQLAETQKHVTPPWRH